MKINNSKTFLLLIIFSLGFYNYGFGQNEKTSEDTSSINTYNRTKIIYWPTAFGLKKGEHYYQNLYLVWQQFHFGVTDNFSLGVSFELINLIFGETTPIFSISPKYTEPLPINDKLRVGVGIWTLFSVDLDYIDGIAVLYGLVSYGTKDNNVTIGLGHGNYGGTYSGIPQINFGFNTRLGKQAGISSEVWLLDQGGNDAFSFVSMSFKFIGNRATLDVGFVKELSSYSSSNFIPMGGLVIPFGKGRKK